MQLVLVIHALENGDDVGLKHHACHDNFVEDVVHLVRVEYQVEFANVFEAPVQCLNKHLNEIKNAEVALELVDCEHEIERGIMTVDELSALAPLLDRALEVITKGIRPLRHLLKHFANHLLLYILGEIAFLLHRLEELANAGLPVVVDNYDPFDHGR